MNRYICIHGHFYQPPRENPWLEAIELQDSAYPYHDWNQRITAESYAPNTASRILDTERKIIDIINNYSKISFNFGPTLLSWMEMNDPEIYRAILEADKRSQERFSGHGSAIAQVYNHIIMPLANSRDKRTQIVWGIKDFEYRFKRYPEGMWLAETAVDLETLDMLAELGIKFTILAPRQANRIRKIDGGRWRSVKDAKVDPKMPYRCNLPSGRSIVLFFYDGPISQDIAFGGLLDNGETFAHRLVSAFAGDNDAPQLVHIATDGESYGHHHKHGDMALTYCLYRLESDNHARITVYGEFLEKCPPSHEVEIFENSSWSCVHGIERWKNNCGCNSGGNPGWSQEWRAPLRGALDWVRDNVMHVFEEHAAPLVRNAWECRDAYINVIHNRETEYVDSFLASHAAKELTKDEKVKILKLLEMQRHALLMYTSCGWFFDEISGIETVQVMQYAARVTQLAHEVSGIPFEDTFIGLLERAPSNIGQFSNGAKVYELFIKPGVLDLLRVGVHFAVSSLFKDYLPATHLHTYQLKKKKYDRFSMGTQKLALGTIAVFSDITKEEQDFNFAALHIGDHNLICGAKQYIDDGAFISLRSQIQDSFTKGQIADVIRIMDKYFGSHSYSLGHLFRDEQKEILDQILETASNDIENSFRQIYDKYFSVIQVMEGFKAHLPRHLRAIIDFVVNTDIIRILRGEKPDVEKLQTLVSEVRRWNVHLDKVTIGYIAAHKIEECILRWSQEVENAFLCDSLVSMLRLLKDLSLDMNLWRAQNVYFSVGKNILPDIRKKKDEGDEKAQTLIERFNELGNLLTVRIE